MEYLDFELPIKELEDQLDKCQVIGEESAVDVSETCAKILQKNLKDTEKEIYKNLSPWQRVQLSRHPITSVYIRLCKGTWLEILLWNYTEIEV